MHFGKLDFADRHAQVLHMIMYKVSIGLVRAQEIVPAKSGSAADAAVAALGDDGLDLQSALDLPRFCIDGEGAGGGARRGNSPAVILT